MAELEAQMERCKRSLVACVALCEEAEGDLAIAPSCFDAQGEVGQEHIFCARCRDYESQDVRPHPSQSVSQSASQ